MIKLVKDFDKLNRTDAINTRGGRTAIMQGETFYSEMRPRAGGFGYGRYRAYTPKAARAMVERGEAEIVEWSSLRKGEVQ